MAYRGTIETKPATYHNLPDLHEPDGRTDVCNARRFAALFQDRCRYCHAWKSWLIWDGMRWKVDDTGHVWQLAKQIPDSMTAVGRLMEDPDDAKAVVAFMMKTASERGLHNLLSLAQSELPITPGELDQHTYLLNCPNGTLDLKTGKLRPHRREDFLTCVSPTAYDADSPITGPEQFMATLFPGQPDVVRFLQQYLGCSLTGDVSLQIMPIAWGEGANGKTTLMNQWMHVLGADYAMQAAPDLLLVKTNDSHPTERADLFGKRFVAATETESQRRLAESTVKQLTGGDRIRARKMRKDFFEFDPTHKLILCTNHKPAVRGGDHGIWRRLRLVEFGQRFEGSTADANLPEKLKADATAWLAWGVRGWLDLQENGLTNPPTIQMATNAYRNSQDIIACFVHECCHTEEWLVCPFPDLWNAFELYCTDCGLRKPPSKKALGGWLKDRFPPSGGKSTALTYEGIELREHIRDELEATRRTAGANHE